jgi:glutathione-regulated potassium-efflux system protein KefB
MAAETHGIDLLPVITLLGAAVVAAPLFKRIGLGSVLGYLAGGIAIGPFGLRLFTHPAAMLQVAELGVVLFLFLIGLEMQPARLWSMRKQIFGLGLVQVVACAIVLTAVGKLLGLPWSVAFVAGAGFVLTSTAIVMQLLEERGEINEPRGQQIVAILLLEDLMIVPLLAIVAALAPAAGDEHAGAVDWRAIGVAIGAVAALILIGRFLLNPLFGLLAGARAREVMTAAALLVVLGAAYALASAGLSMAMGAFIAGVLLSQSHYRHQLEVDIEPFRGVLLGLFFLAVGMSLDLGVVADNWRMIAALVGAWMLCKGAAVFTIARLFGATKAVALDRALLMAQGGEFAFVLYSTAAHAGIVDAPRNAILTAVVVVSMMLTPLVIALMKLLRGRTQPSADGYERPDGLRGTALIIGFGRIGQIASQFLLARGYRISIIDTDVEMIDAAREYSFKVYYGDGTRLDILHAAGAEHAKTVLVCVDDAKAGTRIVELLKAEFPQLPVLARASDRVHQMALIKAGADVQVRETFESALVLGRAALAKLEVPDTEIDDIALRIRERDAERLQLEIVGGLGAGKALFSGRDGEKPGTREET